MTLTNLSNTSLFLLFFVAGCSGTTSGTGSSSGALRDGGGGGDSAPAVVYDDLVVFTSKATFSGNLGGLTGADEKCNTYAKAANLKGTFRAWLSDTKTDAISRVPEGGPWRVLDTSGRQAAVAFANRDAWEGYPEATVDNTEFGKKFSDFSTSSTTEIPYTWTGTKLGGKKYGCACEDWTSSDNHVSCEESYGGAIGSRYARPSNEEWTYVASNPCDAPSALLCFQVP